MSEDDSSMNLSTCYKMTQMQDKYCQTKRLIVFEFTNDRSGDKCITRPPAGNFTTAQEANSTLYTLEPHRWNIQSLSLDLQLRSPLSLTIQWSDIVYSIFHFIRINKYPESRRIPSSPPAGVCTVAPTLFRFPGERQRLPHDAGNTGPDTGRPRRLVCRRRRRRRCWPILLHRQDTPTPFCPSAGRPSDAASRWCRSSHRPPFCWSSSAGVPDHFRVCDSHFDSKTPQSFEKTPSAFTH